MNPFMKLKPLLVCALFFLLGAVVYSNEENEVAKLESLTNDLMDILYSEEYGTYTYEEKAAAVRAVWERDYDLVVVIRRIMGRNWKLLSPAEQSQVKELVAQLVVKAFVEALKGLERPEVKYGEQVMITEKRFEVSSVITFNDGKAINLIYRFGRLKTGWQIYDIVAEGVSIVANYRQQVDDHFRKGTGAELVDKLKELLEEKNTDETIEL